VLNFILLQMRYEGFKKGGNPNAIYIGLAAFACLIIVIIVISRMRSRSNAIKSGKPPARYSQKMFRKKARSLGLSGPHISTLEHLISRFEIKNPFSLLQNTTFLDTILKKGIREIDHQVASNDVKEAEKLTIYHIKQLIERNSQKKTVYATTKQLKNNQSIVVSPETGGRYKTYVTSNLKDAFSVKVPSDEKGSPTRWRKWMPVQAYFFKENGQGYTFKSKALGYNTIKNTSSLLIQHSNSIIQIQQRRYRRKEIEKPAYFYPVKVVTVGVGKDAQKKAVISDKRGALGTILDVSAGGCSIRTNFPLRKGDLIKVEFEALKRNQVTAFGKVKGIRKLKPVGAVMHTQFTRVSRKYLNQINSFVYELEDQAVNKAKP